MKKTMSGVVPPHYREVNGHIHSPYSFSAFDKLDTAFAMAREEKIAVLGINDFLVTDGFDAFHEGSFRNMIFPLFNIEFIGLLKQEQKKGIRINDPDNPGRIYFSGKGLDYPFNPGLLVKWQMKNVIRESQAQIKAMILKINNLISQINPSLSLSYENIRERFAQELVRERHLAKALRHLAVESYHTEEEQIRFIESLYAGKKSLAGINNPAALENEIRSNLIKAGGAAFVEENDSSFPDLKTIISTIIKSGGIPCYPVLLDDPSGKYTEFEEDKEKLCKSLSDLGIGCIELIPGRNDVSVLRDFVEFFDDKEFIITFGTEHNTPELKPLTVTARGGLPLDESLKKSAWEGACIIAAHQYLRAHNRQGYVLSDGRMSHNQKQELARLGLLVIEYYLRNRQYDTGNY